LELKKRASNDLDAVLSLLEVYIRTRQQQQQQTLLNNILKVFRDDLSPHPQNEVITMIIYAYYIDVYTNILLDHLIIMGTIESTKRRQLGITYATQSTRYNGRLAH
jgi:uncharacterized membrane protein